MRALWAALLACCAEAACAHSERQPQRPDGVPADAIFAGDGLWLAPLPEQVEGCAAFRPIAPGRMTTTALYYRKRGGGFTLDRNEAECN